MTTTRYPLKNWLLFIGMGLGFCACDAPKQEPAPTEIEIGGNQWQTFNLGLKVFRNGDSIPFASSKAAWREAAQKQEPAYCYVDNNAATEKNYGLLYNWYAVNDPRQLAPQGYHVASQKEWEDLVDSLSGKNIAGRYLKDTLGWRINPSKEAQAFAARGAGGRNDKGQGFSFQLYAHWWTATEMDSSLAYSLILNGLSESIMIGGANAKGSAFSVRCVKD